MSYIEDNSGPLNLDTPNLDCCSNSELISWSNIFRLLSDYADLTLQAREQRENGYIQGGALANETAAQRIYKSLPKGVRW